MQPLKWTTPPPIKEEPYIPTLDDLVNFTASYETFSPTVYSLKTSDGKHNQPLAGYGSADQTILDLARAGALTQEKAKEALYQRLKSDYDEWERKVPIFKDLDMNIRLALTDTSYNGKGVSSTIKNSPALMKLLNAGVTDAEQIAKELDHSKSAGGWLGQRSAARRAMALGKYDWKWDKVDKYGRHITDDYKGPEDWKASKYINFGKGGVLKRVEPFNDWYKKVPEEKNDTASYNLRRAYELAPQNQLDAFINDPEAHLYSVYETPDGNYEFMKRKDHPTLIKELEWYYGSSKDAKRFRKNYALDTTEDYYKYIKRK